MICIAGSSELSQDGLGAFQESLPPQGGAQIQTDFPKSVCKYVAKTPTADRFPFFLEQAIRYSVMGRPGACYLEIAGDTLRDPCPLANVYFPPPVPDPPRSPAPAVDIQRALACLRSAKSPLIILGKGAGYANATPELTEFVARTQIPFLPTPMGKGVLPDDHELCVSSARSSALKGADVILLVGARLNWILHYGRPPRFMRGVKFIHVEILPEEIGHSLPPEVALCGDAKAITAQLLEAYGQGPFTVPADSEWRQHLKAESAKSIQLFEELANDRKSPMNYYCALSIIDKLTPRDAVVMNEGSDTMDIGRTVLNNYLPRKRLDAGTWGTMGVGMGQAIAGALVCPNPGCVAVFGDAAFGFSAMEFEVVTRYRLPVIAIIINNNGIGPFNPGSWGKTKDGDTNTRLKFPGKSLTPSCRYDLIAEALGATGAFVTTADELQEAVAKATAKTPFEPTVINCMISTTASRGKAAAPPFAAVGKL